jgi:hypothetical protein
MFFTKMVIRYRVCDVTTRVVPGLVYVACSLLLYMVYTCSL